MKLIFATKNKGKLKEVKNLFAGFDLEILSLNDLPDAPEIIEDGKTFEENSLIKSRTIFNKYGIPVIADDSGLSVEQLNGAPGVYSARYAGENATYKENNEKLLRELSSFPPPHKAKFVCCASYVDSNTEIIAFGELHGEIITEFRGENGFGFDPIFVPEDYDKTLAELFLEEKNRISHRAKAMNNLRTELLKRRILRYKI